MIHIRNRQISLFCNQYSKSNIDQ